MQQMPVKKLELKKKTISRLSTAQTAQMGGSYTSIIVYTAGCGSDFTRPRTIYTSGGPSFSG